LAPNDRKDENRRRSRVELPAAMVRDPDRIHSDLIGYGDVLRRNDTLQYDLKIGIFLNPLYILPSEVVLELMHKGILKIVDVPHFEVIPELFKKFQSHLRLENVSFIQTTFSKGLRVNCDG
jgi:hypothetical protein